MSTIALYANEVNLMPELIGDIKASVSNFTTELLSLKGKAVNINSSICNLENVIASIQSSTQTQEDMSDSLDTFQANTQSFISTVDYVDSIVSEAVEQNKDDFYEEYSYLKPDCEKSTGERIAEAIVEAVVTAIVSYVNLQMDVLTWCKDHWKEIVLVVLVVAAIVLIIVITVASGGTALPAIAALGLAVAKGVLIGAAVGGIIGGIVGGVTGGSWQAAYEGMIDGAFSGAITGIFTGGLGGWLGAGSTAVQVIKGVGVGAVTNGFASLFGDLGDRYIKGDDISDEDILFDFALSSIFGGIGGGVGAGLPIQPKFTSGWTSGLDDAMSAATTTGGKVSIKTVLKGIFGETVGGLSGNVVDIIGGFTQEIMKPNGEGGPLSVDPEASQSTYEEEWVPSGPAIWV